MDSINEEFESLLFDWDAKTIDDAGVERLREILRNDEAARTHFLKQQALSAALILEGGAGAGSIDGHDHQREHIVKTASPGRSILNDVGVANGSRLRIWTATVAALLICVLAGRIVYLEVYNTRKPTAATGTDNHTSGAKEATAQGVALLTRLVDIEWADDQVPLEVGDAINVGALKIQAGYAQIEFFCGATVILEGPAELDLKSTTLARVDHGRLRAQVPPAARGFSLEVDDLKVVDLGTEFGLSVSSEGANVQVFDGEVELHDPTDATRLLTEGQAVTRDSAGSFAETEVTPESFLDIASLELRAREQRNERYETWQTWSQTMRDDPRLIAYYAFDQSGGWQRRLESSLQPANSELDGAIVGAHRVAGRWSAKHGLEFKRPGDRVRVQIPGRYDSLTLCAWVKVDSLDRRFNSLFLTDNYNKGEPHWQILDTGQLYFSVKPVERNQEGPPDFKALSPSFWKPSLSGRWIHLATVYDIESNSITHYLNGAVLSQHLVPEEKMVPTQIGAASIGNWSSPTLSDASFAIRNLNGSIDEFALFAAALSGDEVREVYEQGRP